MTGITHILSVLRRKGISVGLDAGGAHLSLKGQLQQLTDHEKMMLREHKTALVDFLRTQQQARRSIPVHEEAGSRFALAPSQQRIWVHGNMNAGTTAYTIPALYSYAIKAFDSDLFSEAIGHLAAAHEALRTIIFAVNGDPVQEILPGINITDHLHFTTLAPGALQQEANRLMAIPFNTTVRPPWQLTVFESGSDQYHFFFRIHHLIADGESLNLMMQAVLQYYEARKQGLDTPVTESIRFRDYVHWICDKKQFAPSSAFWQQELAGFEEGFELPATADQEQGHAGAEYEASISAALRQNILDHLARTRHHLSALLTAAFGIVLGRLTRCNDFIIGLPSASRNHPQLQQLVGNLVNTIPLRIQIDHNQLQHDFTEGLQKKYYAVLDHQLYPFDAILEDIAYRHRPGRFPLFNVMISFPNNQERKKEANQVTLQRNHSLYDLTCTVIEAEDDITLVMEYNRGKYHTAFIKELTAAMMTMLEQLVRTAPLPLRELYLLRPGTGEEQVRSYAHGSSPKAQVPETVIHHFNTCVAQHPDKAAVYENDTLLTYKELQARINSYAAALQAKGLQKGDRAVVQMPASADLLAIAFAIMTNGGIYVPADPALPQKRREQVMEDCRPRQIIDEAVCRELLTTGTETLPAVVPAVAAGDTAYLLYTSGSTGRPKAVAVTHRALAQKMGEEAALMGQGSDMVTIALTNPVFDVSLLEMILPLTTGGAVVIPTPEEIQEPALTAACIRKKRVTVLQGTPTYFAHLFAKVTAAETGNSVRLLCIGGESLSAALVHKIQQALPGVQVNNHYGPTEATIDAVVNTGITNFTQNNIGRPLGDTTAWVVDECGMLLPAGAIGALLLGGPSLAEGYWGQPALTATQFGHYAFTNERLYKTGDLVQWNDNGELIFCGRHDRQVKYNGYRIELEDINAALLRVPGVTQAYTKHAGAALTSWVTAAGSNGTAIREALYDLLPAYMIPAAVVVLDEFPRTATGKTDEQRLPDPVPEEEYRQLTDTEARLAPLWMEVLGTERAGAKDNFFALGGHSLKAIALLARVYKTTGVKITVGEFFTRPDLRSLAAMVGQRTRQVYEPIPRTADAAHYPLSPAQQRVWLASQFADNAIAHHMPLAFVTDVPVDAAALQQALRLLAERHEILRTTFGPDETGMPRQYIHDIEQLPEYFRHITLDGNDEAEVSAMITAETEAPFDLASGPLLRVLLISGSNGRHWLSIVVHHIISDFSSDIIFRRELMQLYEASLHGQFNPLPPLRIQYRDYAVWITQPQQQAQQQQMKQAWLEQLQAPLPQTFLPFDAAAGEAHNYSGAQYPAALPQQTVAAIGETTAREQCSTFSLLLAALGLLLHQYTGHTDMIIGTPVSGKDHPDLDQQLGLYLNMLPLRITINEKDTITQYLQRVQERCNLAFNNAAYPFDQLVTDLAGSLQNQPLFNTVINMVSGAEENAAGLLRHYPTGYARSKFPLCLFVHQQTGSISLVFEYRSALYRPATIERFAARYLEALGQLLGPAASTIGRLAVVAKPKLPGVRKAVPAAISKNNTL